MNIIPDNTIGLCSHENRRGFDAYQIYGFFYGKINEDICEVSAPKQRIPNKLLWNYFYGIIHFGGLWQY